MFVLFFFQRKDRLIFFPVQAVIINKSLIVQEHFPEGEILRLRLRPGVIASRSVIQPQKMKHRKLL